MSFISAVILLFLVMDPVGNIPLFLSVLKGVNATRQRSIVVRELLIALAVLVLFLFAGKYVLKFLNIAEPSLTTAGGIILFLISIHMIFPGYSGLFEKESEGEPFIVPLAIPYIAGPAAIAAVMFIANRNPERIMIWFLALVTACFLSGLILYFASVLSRWLGVRGIIAVERLMGMILVTLAVQMFMTGFIRFFDDFTKAG
ncbi:MAG: NAAT family transporter [Deltaproteobacteria bacterium]|nr:NAAT family transporter [Deltaproteobacteria bacterium]